MRVGLMAENPVEAAILRTGLVPAPMLEAYAPMYARAIVVATKLGIFDGLRGGPARVDARLDGGDDRHDVYRVVVPAGREAVLTITADDTVRGTVLASTARSVAAVTPRAPNLNASGRAFRLTFANRMTRQQTVLADVSLPRAEAGRTITYRLSVALRPAPRLRS